MSPVNFTETDECFKLEQGMPKEWEITDHPLTEAKSNSAAININSTHWWISGGYSPDSFGRDALVTTEVRQGEMSLSREY